MKHFSNLATLGRGRAIPPPIPPPPLSTKCRTAQGLACTLCSGGEGEWEGESAFCYCTGPCILTSLLCAIVGLHMGCTNSVPLGTQFWAPGYTSLFPLGYTSLYPGLYNPIPLGIHLCDAGTGLCTPGLQNPQDSLHPGLQNPQDSLHPGLQNPQDSLHPVLDQYSLTTLAIDILNFFLGHSFFVLALKGNAVHFLVFGF